MCTAHEELAISGFSVNDNQAVKFINFASLNYVLPVKFRCGFCKDLNECSFCKTDISHVHYIRKTLK